MIEIGLFLGVLGGVGLVLAGVLPSRRPQAILVAGVLVGAGFVLALIAVHFGVSPFKTVVPKKHH
jgi:hypothetical protein